EQRDFRIPVGTEGTAECQGDPGVIVRLPPVIEPERIDLGSDIPAVLGSACLGGTRKQRDGEGCNHRGGEILHVYSPIPVNRGPSCRAPSKCRRSYARGGWPLIRQWLTSAGWETRWPGR